MTDFKNTPELSESTEPAISYSTCYASFLYVVLFSGGRTSAFLAKYMKEHPHYKNCIFVFMNTGKEREETLQFADKCDKEFGLNLVYLEALVEMAQRPFTKAQDLHELSQQQCDLFEFETDCFCKAS